MNYNKKTVLDVDVSGKKVLLRCDFNVPQDKETGEITSDKRIVAALPTIRYLLDHGAAVIACSHLGKPEAKFDKWVKKQTEKGKDPATLTEEKWKKSLDKLTLAPVAKRLSELLGKDVIFAHDVVGEDAKAKAAALKGGEIMLLENTRFEAGETKNDPELAKALASMAELYVSDNGSLEENAVSAASSIVSAGAMISLGSYGSGVSIAAADTFAEAQIPAIGVSCTNASVTDGHDWYFRICFLDPFQGSVMAQFAWDMVAAA
jgi:3-phosphoglycerate kinase